MENQDYWKDLVSLALQALQDEKQYQAVFVINNSILGVEFNSHDNWDGGIDYWDIEFQLKYRDYKTVIEQKEEIEKKIHNALFEFMDRGPDRIANVIVKPIIERIFNWRAILPETKDQTINLIEEEKKQLTAIATGTSYKECGAEESYQQRHRTIVLLAGKVGFEYPIKSDSLAEWWIEIRNIGGYANRRAYISQLFAPLLKQLRESDEPEDVDFIRIETQSGAVQKAIEDAHVFIREGKYDSAVDRVHTAFHGYLRYLLQEHGSNNLGEESLPGLFAKLHSYYEGHILPTSIGGRIKMILRSAGAMINAINELRNNNTVAHPNGQLIQEREAKLVIRLVSAVLEYIQDIEINIFKAE